MSNVHSNTQKWIQSWENKGADLMGVTIQVSVSVPVGNEVEVSKLKQAVRDSIVLPDRFAPVQKNPYSLYLKTISQLGRMSIKKFDIEPGDNFDIETHDTYTVDTVHRAIAEKEPCKHRVYHKKKLASSIEDDVKGRIHNDLQDVSFDDSILFILERTKGTVADDESGDSEFEISVIPRNEKNEVVSLDGFAPFIRTLNSLYESKLEGKYTSEQVRTWLMKVILDDIRADNIHRGTYFVPVEKMDLILELSSVLKKVHPGISIFCMPVVAYKDADKSNPVLNQSLQVVQTMLGDSVLKEAESLLNELEALKARDDEAVLESGKTTVRSSTYVKRMQEFTALTNKVKEYQNRTLLVNDSIEFMFEDIEGILKQQLGLDV